MYCQSIVLKNNLTYSGCFIGFNKELMRSHALTPTRFILLDVGCLHIQKSRYTKNIIRESSLGIPIAHHFHWFPVYPSSVASSAGMWEGVVVDIKEVTLS